tara:strand:+ start:2556 stop:2738 length:183 start_codon:yes stop_codon:yes gene_type:complete
MNANKASEEMEMAAYQFAEAERLERQAKALRMKALMRVGAVSSYFKEGIKTMRKTKGQTE